MSVVQELTEERNTQTGPLRQNKTALKWWCSSASLVGCAIRLRAEDFCSRQEGLDRLAYRQRCDLRHQRKREERGNAHHGATAVMVGCRLKRVCAFLYQ